MTDISRIQGMKIPDWSKDELKKKLSKEDLLEFLNGVYGPDVFHKKYEPLEEK